jgi:cell wall-associated NlpC family hydrolase
LVQAAYKAAGITLPRTAQAQYDATTKLAPDDPLAPGDLVFFGGEPSNVEHVGIYVGMEGDQAVMVDAPYTGADVRVESFPTTVGASWGTDTYLGATTAG